MRGGAPQTRIPSLPCTKTCALLPALEQCFNGDRMALLVAQDYISAHPTSTEPTMKSKQYLALDGADGVRIQILERSETALVIRWIDPGRCHYGEQRWRRRSAHTSGTCAVTRRKIRRGDAVFKPAERPAPLNAAVMISAEVFGNLGIE